jgi:cytochrome oxidase Cu insertion factor (SCO1/SenC/PrrC family)
MPTKRYMLSASFVACLLAPQHTGVSLWAAARTVASGALPRLSRIDADVTFSPTIPDVLIYDQYGRSLRFRSDLLKGKTVAINFIFTSCTTICPPLTMAMRAIQRELADRVGRDIWLISVSIDPTVDRPERLRTFATAFGAGDGWTFVTGSKGDIDRLLKAFGSYGGDVGAHSTTMLIGNEQAGRWVRTTAWRRWPRT